MFDSLALYRIEWRAFATVIMTFALRKHVECLDL